MQCRQGAQSNPKAKVSVDFEEVAGVMWSHRVGAPGTRQNRRAPPPRERRESGLPPR